jgi:tRNA wybutosine-synthesizing protein 4
LIHSDVVISLPTFIIAECVLIYLDPDSSHEVVGWACRTFSTAVFFLYEQVTITTFIVSHSTTFLMGID